METKLMNYDEFVELFKILIIEKCDSENNNIEIEFDTIQKVNGLKHCLMASTKTENIKKTIYFDEIYNDYSSCGNLEKVCKNVIDAIKSDEVDIDTEEITSILNDISVIKSRITFFVINASYNRVFLNTLPHRYFLDLAIVYKFSLFKNGEAIGKVMITNDMMKRWDVTEEELYNLSLTNTEMLFPTVVKTISNDFRIVTNVNNINGASGILNKDVFRDLSDIINDNIYIVPSSVHELITLKASNHAPDEVKSVIEKVNNDILSKEDILSYNLYIYDKEKDDINIYLNEEQYFS